MENGVKGGLGREAGVNGTSPWQRIIFFPKGKQFGRWRRGFVELDEPHLKELLPEPNGSTHELINISHTFVTQLNEKQIFPNLEKALFGGNEFPVFWSC